MKKLVIGIFIGMVISGVVADIITSSVSMGDFHTDWYGSPMFSKDGKYDSDQYWLHDIRIGLRADGVVVWRKK